MKVTQSLRQKILNYEREYFPVRNWNKFSQEIVLLGVREKFLASQPQACKKGIMKKNPLLLACLHSQEMGLNSETLHV